MPVESAPDAVDGRERRDEPADSCRARVLGRSAGCCRFALDNRASDTEFVSCGCDAAAERVKRRASEADSPSDAAEARAPLTAFWSSTA
eukprot:932666-Prymnesium_polylepis.1